MFRARWAQLSPAVGMGNVQGAPGDILEQLGLPRHRETRGTPVMPAQQESCVGLCGDSLFTECLERQEKGEKREHKFSRRAVVLQSSHAHAGDNQQLLHYGDADTAEIESRPEFYTGIPRIKRAGEPRTHGFKPQWLQGPEQTPTQTPQAAERPKPAGVPWSPREAKLSSPSGARVVLKTPRVHVEERERGATEASVADARLLLPSPMPVPSPTASPAASPKAIEHSLSPRAHLSPSHAHAQIYDTSSTQARNGSDLSVDGAGTAPAQQIPQSVGG